MIVQMSTAITWKGLVWDDNGAAPPPPPPYEDSVTTMMWIGNAFFTNLGIPPGAWHLARPSSSWSYWNMHPAWNTEATASWCLSRWDTAQRYLDSYSRTSKLAEGRYYK